MIRGLEHLFYGDRLNICTQYGEENAVRGSHCGLQDLKGGY